MKLTAMAAMTILGMNAWAGQEAQTGTRVAVCLVDHGQTAVRFQATARAAKMYSAIGVMLDWQSTSRACQAAGVIHIELTDSTPANLMPGALAYALPYEGIHIRVFYDRLQHTVPESALPFLLAHVLVHEIGHILQGVARHSPTGVMKAHWTPADYRVMEMSHLPFTDDDLTYIQDGLQARNARLLAANVVASR
jgi:hypothetical protein